MVTGTPTSATLAKKPAAGEITSASADGCAKTRGEGAQPPAKKLLAKDETPAAGTLDDTRPGAGAVPTANAQDPGTAVLEAGAAALLAEGNMLAAGTLEDETPVMDEPVAASLLVLVAVCGRSSAAGTLAEEALELLPAS